MMLPGLEELLSLRGSAQGLRLATRIPARATVHGAHVSAQRGRGLDFQEVRAYVAGDDPRSIDWRVTARRGRPHTKLYREERERPVWLLVDLQPGLFFGSRRQLKSALAVRAAALLAWIASLDGDRVGAVLSTGPGALGAAGSGVHILPPRARRAGVLPLLDALLHCQPDAPATPAPQSLAESLRAIVPLIRPGSLLVLISDFALLDADGPVRELQPPAADHRSGLVSAPLFEADLGTIRAHSPLVLLWLTDPLEQSGLPTGRYRVGLPVGESILRTRVLDGAAVHARWLEIWRAREARLHALADRLAARPVLRLDTSESVEEALRPLLRAQRRAA